MKSFFHLHRKSLTFIWEAILQKHKGYFLWIFFSLIVSSSISIVLPYLAKLEIDQLDAQSTVFFGMDFHSPIILFAVILGASFLANIMEDVISFLFSLKTRIQKELLDFGLKKDIFSRLYTIDPGYTVMNRFKRMIGSVIQVINKIPEDIERIVKDYIGSVLEFVAIGFVVSFFDWRIFLIILFASLINYLINRFSEYYRRKHELSNQYELNWEINTIQYTIEDSYHHIASNGATNMLFDRFFALKNQQIHATKKKEKIEFVTRIAEQLSNGIATIAVKLLVGYLIFSLSGSIGLMTMATIYMSRMSNITDRFFRVFTDRYDIIENISILQFFLDFIEEKKQNRDQRISGPINNITFSDVCFSYPKPAQAEISFLDIKINTLRRILGKEKNDYTLDELHMYEEAKKEAKNPNPEILHGIDMSLERGKLYGIVGKNGAGKSTLTSLLLGFFSEYQGNISIDGREFSDIDRDDIQKLVSYISQEPYTMHGRFTIRDNLMLGVHREVSDDELFSYLELFGMKEKIQKEREGLDTRLKWDMDLSGGQKQILVLIRVILQDRPVLILDEGTNQLDAENEMRVMNALLKNRSDKIILFVTHRMNTMKKCDWIYTIVDGAIEDQGTPKILASRDNAFKRFLEIGEQHFT